MGVLEENRLQEAVAAEAVRRALAGDLPVVLVHQMGKVGSTSVVAALRAATPFPVFQTHALGPSVERHKAELLMRGEKVPFHVEAAVALRRALLSGVGNAPWRFVSLVRDPVARQVSNFFENVHRHAAQVFDAHGTLEADAVLRHLQDHLAKPGSYDYVFQWFDRELKAVMGVDLLAFPFDRDRGWSCYRRGQTGYLVIQLERLLTEGPRALAAFLDLAEPPPIPHVRGRRAAMEFASVYERVKRELLLPPKVCAQVYGHPFSRHFYGEDDLAAFARRWCGGGAQR